MTMAANDFGFECRMPADYLTRRYGVVRIKGGSMSSESVRVHDLVALLPKYTAFIQEKPVARDVTVLVEALARAERAEFGRGSPIMRWNYDPIRHVHLRRHLRWERELLRLLTPSRETAE